MKEDPLEALIKQLPTTVIEYSKFELSNLFPTDLSMKCSLFAKFIIILVCSHITHNSSIHAE